MLNNCVLKLNSFHFWNVIFLKISSPKSEIKANVVSLRNRKKIFFSFLLTFINR